MDFFVKQLSASFIIDSLLERIHTLSEKEQEKIWNYYRHFSDFELITNFEGNGLAPNSSLRLSCLVGQNIIRRGIPTRAPKRVEYFLQDMDINIDNLPIDILLQHICVLDPKFKFDPQGSYYCKTDSNKLTKAAMNATEREFLRRLPRKMGQLLEYQKSVEAIIDFPNTDINKYPDYTKYCLNYTKDKLKAKFKNQMIDFTFQFPVNAIMNSNVAIELDGPQHEEFLQQQKDRERDTLLTELSWNKTIRITDIHKHNSSLDKFLNTVPEPVAVDSDIAYLVRFPMFVARVAVSILNLIESGHINISVPKLAMLVECDTNIDYKATKLGIRVAFDLIHHITTLQGKTKELPTVYLDRQIGNKQVEEVVTSYGEIPEEGRGRTKYQVTLHVAMHQRLVSFNPVPTTDKSIWILSAYSHEHISKVETNERQIPYKISSDTHDSLRYFLYEIFRKKDFQSKQLDIIGQALSRNSVLGLLPTGSGKTLTFQLSVLLQPGITIVIAPLISLMTDQLYNLQQHRIDRCAYLNSTLQTYEKLRTIEEFEREGLHLLYIAPERLLNRSFIESLYRIRLSMAVLDEAHCISQWGHDFRTSYLYVGEILQKVNHDLVIMALTGTASCNVITDIKRDLRLNRKFSIVTPNNFRRKELQFLVLYEKRDMNLAERIKAPYLLQKINQSLQYLYGDQNTERPNILIERFAKTNERKSYINGGLIFIPYADGEVASVKSAVKGLNEHISGSKFRMYKDISFDSYYGSLSYKEKNDAQNKFVTNKTLFLVSTKAFGMGIDKSNIRFTLHTTIPESIEAFYQEAGRAGRDGAHAVNIILAPPRNLSFDRIKDAQIYNSFMKKSFPKLESFLKAVDSFFVTPYRTFLNLKQYLEVGFSELDFKLSKIINIRYSEKENSMYMEIHIKPRVYTYKVTFINSECRFTAVAPNIQLDATTAVYVESILLHVKNKIMHTPELNSIEGLRNALNRPKTTVNKSLSEVVTYLDRNRSLEFYVELDDEYINEKIVFYLSRLKIFESIERSYSPKYMRLQIRCFDKQTLIDGIKEFLNSYETHTYVVQKIKEVEKEFSTVRDDDYRLMLIMAVKYIVKYSYEQIRTYREMQTRTMYQCIQAGDERKPEVFINEVYRYFESTYTDELMKSIDKENIKTMVKWIDEIEVEAKKAPQNHLNNLSHLRTSSLKVMEARPQAFTPHFLYAYGILQDSNLDINTGLDSFISGMIQIAKVRKNYKANIRRFCYKMLNSSDKEHLESIKERIKIYNNDSLEILEEVVSEVLLTL